MLDRMLPIPALLALLLAPLAGCGETIENPDLEADRAGERAEDRAEARGEGPLEEEITEQVAEERSELAEDVGADVAELEQGEAETAAEILNEGGSYEAEPPR